MLSKQLLFRLGTIFFIISVLGILFYKVDTISIDIKQRDVQAQMEPLFFIDGELKNMRLKYEIVDPIVTMTDKGTVDFQGNITLDHGLDKAWGTIAFSTELTYLNKNKSFYLKIPDQVKITVHGQSSDEPSFRVWNRDAKPLLADMKEKLNNFLFEQKVYVIDGKHLRIQAQDFSIQAIQHTDEGLHLILKVDQGIFIIITYFVMFLSVFLVFFAYFFIGEVGFKDDPRIGFRDLRDTPRAAERKRKLLEEQKKKQQEQKNSD